MNTNDGASGITSLTPARASRLVSAIRTGRVSRAWWVALVVLALVAIPSAAFAAPQASSYIVQPGDTLANIAHRLGVSTTDLAAANGIKNANFIHAGQALSTPSAARASDKAKTSASAASATASTSSGGNRWIEIDLTYQELTAFVGATPVFNETVSTGKDGWETPTGEFTIDTKLDSQTMWGADYYLPDVPWVMYFYGGYAIHGAYWHTDFGTRLSHGCVNLPLESAAWLYDWASEGTIVWVHY